MFGLGFQEMVVIAVLVLLFFPADDLPALMRTAGRWYAKMRRASDELRRAFNAEVARAESEHRLEEVRLRREAQARARAEAEAPSAPEAATSAVAADPTSDPPGALRGAGPPPQEHRSELPPTQTTDAHAPAPADAPIDAPTPGAAPSPRPPPADPRLRAYVPLDQRHDDEAPRVTRPTPAEQEP